MCGGLGPEQLVTLHLQRRIGTVGCGSEPRHPHPSSGRLDVLCFDAENMAVRSRWLHRNGSLRLFAGNPKQLGRVPTLLSLADP